MDAEFTRIALLPCFHFVFALACLYNEALLASDVNVDNYNSMELLNLSFFWVKCGFKIHRSIRNQGLI